MADESEGRGSAKTAELGADELHEIVAEARAWLDSGAPFGLPAEAALSLSPLSPLAEGYAEGVIAERLRGRERRERRELARTLHGALLNMKGAFDTSVTRRHRPFDEFQEEAVASMRDALELARKAGLLEGGEK